MLLHEVKSGIKTVAQLKDLTQNLNKTTMKYRALKTPAALKDIQDVEDKIERDLGQK